MKAKLVLISPTADGKQYELKLPTKIGRGQDAKVKLMHPLVSRIHCELFDDGEKVMVRDLASLNGTFVDDTRVADEMAVPSGSRLMVGSAQFYLYYGKDYDNPPVPKAAVRSDAPTKMADETVRMAGETKPVKKPQKAIPVAAPTGAAHGDDLDFDLSLADDTVPAPTAKTIAMTPVAKTAAKAAPSAAAKKARPANPAELADDDEIANSGRPFVASGGKPAAAAPDPKKAAPAKGGADEPASSGDDDLDNFFKAIM